MMKNVRFFSLLVACYAWCAAVAEQSKGLAPSPLEAFAARPTATVIWSKSIGRLQSRYSQATFTLMMVEDRTAAPRQMRGLRIDLAHLGGTPSCDWKYTAWRIMCLRPNAAIWVAEDRLEPVRYGITRGAAELRPFEFISRYGTQDAYGRGSSGVIVCGYDFPDLPSLDLATFFARAISELKEAPR